MKFFLLLFLGFFLIGFTKVNTKQQKYLPVYVSILDTSNIPSTFLLHLKAGFGTRKIKTLSKEDSKLLIRNETALVTENYYKSGGDLRDVEKWKHYMATNVQDVGNMLTLSIKIDANGIINDTVKWVNRSLIVNMVNPPKTKWRYMILDSNNAKTMLQMTQSIVDSVIASHVLIKE